MEELIQALQSLASNLQGAIPLINTLAQITGIVFIASGMYGATKIGESGRHTPGTVAVSIATGAMLVSFQWFIGALSESLGLGGNDYSSILGDGSLAGGGGLQGAAKGAIAVFMVLSGSLAVYRGVTLLRADTIRGEPEGWGRALMWIAGGILAINYKPVVQMIGQAINLPPLLNIIQMLL